MIREIVTIDEDLCDGCGLCVPSCEEGALRIVNGKATLVSDRLCDGLGACLGHCPRGAIRIQHREAEAFDEEAVAEHLKGTGAARTDSAPSPRLQVLSGDNGQSGSPAAGGCPGNRFARFDRRGTSSTGDSAAASAEATPPSSELQHWPVQLRLLSPEASVLQNANLLVAADCVPVAYGAFHSELLRDKAVVIACPKLDDTRGYVEKLAAMIGRNDLAKITVARMEVPCCAGILRMVLAARELAQSDVPVHEVLISIRGEVLARRPIPSGCGVKQ
ncbi:MAG: 4Fe-4S binding protein [Phycisphaerales bacterium]|nr:MAG: 4Fe-4S binding protein [Phycisphaerales bacterium]